MAIVKWVGLAPLLIAWHHAFMDTTALDAATRRYRKAEAALDKARTELTAEVLTWLESMHGERGAQAEASRRTGWSREQIRQIVRAAESGRAPAADELNPS